MKKELEPKYVYLVVYNVRDDDNSVDEKEHNIFSSYEKAKKQFDKWVNDDKNEDGGIGYEVLNGNENYIIDTDEKDYYFAFEDGYAASNYTEVVIYKMEME